MPIVHTSTRAEPEPVDALWGLVPPVLLAAAAAVVLWLQPQPAPQGTAPAEPAPVVVVPDTYASRPSHLHQPETHFIGAEHGRRDRLRLR